MTDRPSRVNPQASRADAEPINDPTPTNGSNPEPTKTLSERARAILAAVQAACGTGYSTMATDMDLGGHAGLSSSLAGRGVAELAAAGVLMRQKCRGRRKITLLEPMVSARCIEAEVGPSSAAHGRKGGE